MLYDEYDTVFMDGELTSLMINKKGDRNMKPKRLDYGIYKLLKSFLSNYDIHIGGATMIGEYEVLAITISKSFDIKNEPILRALYGFTSGRVNIPLNYSRTDNENCAYAFWYDLTDFSCTFEKYVFGATQESVRYGTLKEMLATL